jgi:hypothetical protein
MNTTDTAIVTEPYLVTCTHRGHPPHAWILDAPSADIAAAMAQYRYGKVTGVHWAEAVRVTAYADLPEIMFGEDAE